MQIQALKVGKVVNISIDGKLRKKVCDTKETADKLFKLVLKVKENPTEKGIETIYAYLNDKTRVAMECGLESDFQSGEVYLAGFNTPIPMDLVEIIKDYHENGYPLDAIINFWKLLMVNPDTRVRESLFEFINTHDFVLTDTGYMVVYKAVRYRLNKADDLSEFLAKSYLHVKKDWNCSPRKYMVYMDVEKKTYHITKKETAANWDEKKKGIEILGNLKDMFENLDKYIENSEAPYTDKYSGTMEIKLGHPVLMDRKDCNSNPTQECSYGLHVGATRYVEWYGNESDAILVCYVNPAHVVAVPDYDKSKMRVSEYFPFALAEFEDGKIDIIEQSYFESDYTHYEAEELNKMVAKIQAKELPVETERKNEEIKEERSLVELQKIIENRLIDISQ